MQELWIPTAIITLFLFLNIIKPLIRKFEYIDGIAWLPFLALLSAIAMLPAYGFRPESIPLFLYTAVLAVVSLIKRGWEDYKYGNPGAKRIFFIITSLIFLAAVSWTAFYHYNNSKPF